MSVRSLERGTQLECAGAVRKRTLPLLVGLALGCRRVRDARDRLFQLVQPVADLVDAGDDVVRHRLEALLLQGG
jgi:hypothetical protein